ncbi:MULTISPECIES: DUF6597 domain-containing transcriptional factor [Brevibacterium]|uniref:DUF6597 domain-containing transcriptional factor n=1 Tax=Brevibacterium TaxID=1696 RepID=UPI001867E349|nr:MULTISPECIES: DUF6597 domain-containing transcriptional factor [Brevibacterium]
MYTEMRIPRLRASLWTSAPDARPTSALAEVAVSVPSKPSLIVPDGCMDLIVIDSLVVAGADSTARTFHSASTSGAAQPVVGLRFDPGVLPQLLATSAAELADRVTPLDAVVTAGSLATVPEPGPGVGQRRLLDIAEVAAQFAYSPRQLRRLSSAWFVYGPKHLSKVLRWQAARALIDAGSTRTAAATATGYADAAYLWRDEKSLLGR